MAQAATAPAPNAVSRRRLFRWGLLGVVGAIFAQAGVAFVYFFRSQKGGAFGGDVEAGKIQDIPDNSITRVSKGKFYLSRTDAGITALYWRCRHLGCTVPFEPSKAWEGQQGIFVCPCHGSTYLRNGQIVFGPAPGPLDVMEMRIDQSGTIVVNTGAIRRRDRAKPEHFIPAQPGSSGPTAPDLIPWGTGI